jgi:hypothetical protein
LFQQLAQIHPYLTFSSHDSSTAGRQSDVVEDGVGASGDRNGLAVGGDDREGGGNAEPEAVAQKPEKLGRFEDKQKIDLAMKRLWLCIYVCNITFIIL